jgi:hypothetical protein
LPNYGYSSAMKGADFVWNKEKLDSFIAKPDEVVPGSFLAKGEARRILVDGRHRPRATEGKASPQLGGLPRRRPLTMLDSTSIEP